MESEEEVKIEETAVVPEETVVPVKGDTEEQVTPVEVTPEETLPVTE